MQPSKRKLQEELLKRTKQNLHDRPSAAVCITTVNYNSRRNIATPTWRSLFHGSSVSGDSDQDDDGDAKQRPPTIWSREAPPHPVFLRLIIQLETTYHECSSIFDSVHERATTETNKKACTWLREFCSCSCLTVLPGLAWVLFSKIYIPFCSPL